MSSVSELSDNDLRDKLIECGFVAGPVTGTTRRIYEKKLETLRRGDGDTQKSNGKAATPAAATPQKNGAPLLALASTPVSAKRRGRKPQVLASELSDNKLNLMVSSDVFDDPPSATASNRKAANGTSTGAFDQTPPRPEGVAHRTPTPPRASRTPRTPLRNDASATHNLSTCFRGNIFLSPAAKLLSAKSTRSATAASDLDSFGGLSASSADDEEPDDHLETSRIVPRFEGRDTFGASRATVKSDSPIDKLRRFASGYFSRSTATSTPCHSYGESNRRTRYKPMPLQRPVPARQTAGDSCDVSGWIVIVCITFLVLIVAAYVWSTSFTTIQTAASRVTVQGSYTRNQLRRNESISVLFFGGAAFQFNKWRAARANARQERLMELVEQITEIISEHGCDGVPELHVRDIIMPPTKRTTEDWTLWTDAAAFINVEDSRVRTEIRLVNGDECNVWVWVQTAAHKWQGAAVDDRTLGQNIPPKALTRCIKLRGIEIPARESELCVLRTELLRRLSPVVPVHMDFARAPESVVYLMLKSLDDAKRAFVAFHSQWFQGGMIGAKYLRDERYVERFPDAVRCY